MNYIINDLSIELLVSVVGALLSIINRFNYTLIGHKLYDDERNSRGRGNFTLKNVQPRQKKKSLIKLTLLSSLYSLRSIIKSKNETETNEKNK